MGGSGAPDGIARFTAQAVGGRQQSAAGLSGHAGQVLEATRGLLLVYGVGALCGPVLGGIAMEGIGPPGLPAMSAITTGALALFGIYRVTRRAAPALEEQAEFVPMVRTSPMALEMLPDAEQDPELDLAGRDPE